MMDQLSRNDIIDALACRIVVLLFKQGVTIEEAKAVLGLVLIEVKSWGAEVSELIH